MDAEELMYTRAKVPGWGPFLDTVEPWDACPECGENLIDNLVWDDDGAFITCGGCNTQYVPGS